MFCKNCGNEVRDGAKFCSKCGTAISETTEKSAKSSAESQAQLKPKKTEQQAPKQYTISTFEQFIQLKKKINTVSEFEISDNIKTGFIVVPALFMFFLFYKLGLGFLLMIVGAIVGGIIGTVLFKVFLSLIPDAYTKEGRQTIQANLDTYEKTILKPLETEVISDVKNRLHLSEEKLWFSINERNSILMAKIYLVRSLDVYREKVEKACLLKAARIKIKAFETLQSELTDLYNKNKNRYSEPLCQALNAIAANEEVIQKCQDNMNEESIEGILTFEKDLEKAQEMCNIENDSIANENSELEKTFQQLEKTFDDLQAKLVQKNYYSEEFRKLLKKCREFFEIPILDRDLSLQEYNDLLSDIDLKLKKLQELYQSESEDVQNRWKRNTAIAADLLTKFEDICSEGNDVVYSYDLESMKTTISHLIKDSGNELDAANIEKKMKELERRRKSERDSIMKTIRDYEAKIQRARDLVRVYEKTSEGQVLYKGFLKRRRSKG